MFYWIIINTSLLQTRSCIFTLWFLLSRRRADVLIYIHLAFFPHTCFRPLIYRHIIKHDSFVRAERISGKLLITFHRIWFYFFISFSAHTFNHVRYFSRCPLQRLLQFFHSFIPHWLLRLRLNTMVMKRKKYHNLIIKSVKSAIMSSLKVIISKNKTQRK